MEQSLKEYEKPQNRLIAYNSAKIEAQGYGKCPRLREIADFALKCGFKKVGLAHCIGLQQEAAKTVKIFKALGLEVEPVACKCGSFPKTLLGLEEQDMLKPGIIDSMCNPIGQAMVLEKAKTQLNIILGLCVGHDTLFIRYSKAPVTVLAAKDRVTGHNPLAALYCADSYFKDKIFPEEEN